VVKANPADVAAVLARRAERTPRVSLVGDIPGAHVWAASGLTGWPGGAPANVWAQSGLRDAFANFKDKTHDPSDWVTTVANAMNGKR
jgi:hypothetical protein